MIVRYVTPRRFVLSRRMTAIAEMFGLSMFLFVGLAFQGVAAQVTAQVAATNEGHCIWYGECYTDPTFMHVKNCPYDGPGKALDMRGQEIFAKHCPHMIPTTGDVPKTCCDTKQLMTLDKNIRLASSILQRCPSCMSNFAKQICEFTCSPHQSTFVNVTQMEKTENAKYVNGIQVYFTSKYFNETYKSCSRVSMPSSGQLALDLMCGEYGSSRCSPERWFNYMGDSNNPFVPFQIDYIATDKPIDKFQPMDPEITPCNKPLNAKSPACSCVDCEESCPAPPPLPPLPRAFKLIGYDGYAVIMTIIFLCGATIFILSLLCFNNRRKIVARGEEVGRQVGRRLAAGLHHPGDGARIALAADQEDSPLQSKRSSVISADDLSSSLQEESSTFLERLGAGTDKFLQKFFCRWGTACASHPWTVLCLGFIFIVVVSYGIKYLHVTTDPVELWASPSSRSRVERAYFDSHFEPFYRTEQIIITSVDLPPVIIFLVSQRCYLNRLHSAGDRLDRDNL